MFQPIAEGIKEWMDKLKCCGPEERLKHRDTVLGTRSVSSSAKKLKRTHQNKPIRPALDPSDDLEGRFVRHVCGHEDGVLFE